MAKKNNDKKSKAIANFAKLASAVRRKAAMQMVKNSRKKPAPAFGALSTVNTAPVAIGNSIRGAKQQVIQAKDGVTVRGRDFAFSPIGTGSVGTWTACGGTPLTPAAFSDSTLRQYLQMYQKFRWKKCVVHYITSSPTTASGDIMFYYSKNRDSVFLSQTSSQLLSFVLSDDDTVIGPQWMNHSAPLQLKGIWRSTDYGMGDDVNSYADGDVFLLSKTSTTDSPGYVMIDYEVEFAQLQISPRLLSLPLPRAQWYQTNFLTTTTAVTSGNAVNYIIAGNNISGAAAGGPVGLANGDIYKVFVDVTNSSTPTNITFATGFHMDVFGGFVTVPIVDGTTFYLVYDGTQFGGYPNAAAAYAGGNDQFVYGVTATVTWGLQAWISLVGTVSSINLSPNY